jgi:hypothetical protein
MVVALSRPAPAAGPPRCSIGSNIFGYRTYPELGKFHRDHPKRNSAVLDSYTPADSAEEYPFFARFTDVLFL